MQQKNKKRGNEDVPGRELTGTELALVYAGASGHGSGKPVTGSGNQVTGSGNQVAGAGHPDPGAVLSIPSLDLANPQHSLIPQNGLIGMRNDSVLNLGALLTGLMG